MMDTARRRSKWDRFRILFGEVMARAAAIEQRDDARHQWVLETKAGRLGLSAQKWTSPAIGVAIVFCRFDDPVRVRPYLGGSGNPVTDPVNPFTGKWNHHYDSSWSPEDAAEHFESQLRRIL